MFQGGSLWGGLISGGLSQLQDTTALSHGKINKNEYAVQTTENVTGAVGIMAGIEYGAVWGSTLMPGVGTLLGAAAGAFIGDRIGRTLGHQAGNALFNRGNWMLKDLSLQNQNQNQTQMNPV